MNILIALVLLTSLFMGLGLMIAYFANKMSRGFDPNDPDNKYLFMNTWLTKSEIDHAEWADAVLTGKAVLK